MIKWLFEISVHELREKNSIRHLGWAGTFVLVFTEPPSVLDKATSDKNSSLQDACFSRNLKVDFLGKHPQVTLACAC